MQVLILADFSELEKIANSPSGCRDLNHIHGRDLKVVTLVALAL